MMPVDKSLIESLIDDVRRRLVHEYGQISKEKLVEFVNKDLGDIDEYIKQIAAYLVSD